MSELGPSIDKKDLIDLLDSKVDELIRINKEENDMYIVSLIHFLDFIDKKDSEKVYLKGIGKSYVVAMQNSSVLLSNRFRYLSEFSKLFNTEEDITVSARVYNWGMPQVHDNYFRFNFFWKGQY